MTCHRKPYHQTLRLGLLLLWPGWKLLCRSFPESSLSSHAGRLFELLVRPLGFIIFVRWINGINYSLTAPAGVRLLSIIWSLLSSMRNICVPSYSQPPSSWREGYMRIRLMLFCKPLQAAVSGFSIGRRCWIIHTFHTCTIFHTWSCWCFDVRHM